MIKLLHISDLHFDESRDGKPTNYRHSLTCLREIERICQEQCPSHLVVTGDITNIGDIRNLERAYQWIDDQIFSEGEYYGLRTRASQIDTLIVPGNHDAFNAPANGAEYKRWQSSLSNYYDAFREHAWSKEEDGVKYKWASSGSANVFFCLVDSCYLGDPETEHIPKTLSFDRVAKGRISRKQSAAVLQVFDRGIRGELSAQDGSEISKSAFLGSLKILVMHHYLFEPSDARAQPLLQLQQKRLVFQNIAMSDFDVLLCGHKHIADVTVRHYADHFDPRGKLRLAFNYVRRILGIDSLPLRFDEDGRSIGKMFRLVVAMITLSRSRESALTDETAHAVISILERALDNPDVLKEELIRNVRARYDLHQGDLFDANEFNDIYKRIRTHFDRSERAALCDAANRLRGLVSHLTTRPFAHVACASSAKCSENEGRSRGLNMYEITCENDGYLLKISQYAWDKRSHRYCPGAEQRILFPQARVLNSAV